MREESTKTDIAESAHLKRKPAIAEGDDNHKKNLFKTMWKAQVIDVRGSARNMSEKANLPSRQLAHQGGMVQVGYEPSLESALAGKSQTPDNSQICQVLQFHKMCQPYPGKLVIIVSVSHEMIDFFSQWHVSASRFLDESCMHLSVIAEDEAAKRSLSSLSQRNNWNLDIQAKFSKTNMIQLPYNSAKYDRLVNRRPLYIQDFLQQGCTTFYVDIDTIWKKNPFLEIIAKENGQGDLYTISDVCKDVGAVTYFCTCFLYMNPTETSSKIVGKWIEHLQANTPNQRAFSNVLLNDHSLQSKVTLLPYNKFPPGCSYSRFSHDAVIAHANWLTGHEAKAKFLNAVAQEMRHELWEVTSAPGQGADDVQLSHGEGGEHVEP
jgi:hypothetical protein